MLARPADPDLGPSPAVHAVRLGAAALLAGYSFFTFGLQLDARIGAVLGVVGAIGIVAVNGRQVRRRDA
jgi:hypothetical protein